MEESHHDLTLAEVCRRIICLCWIGCIGNQLMIAQPMPVEPNGIEAFMDSLFRVPQIEPSLMEECTQFLQAMLEVVDVKTDECWKIERARATIVVGCMLGGHSKMLKSVMDASDACVPDYGGFEYCIGNIHFLNGNYEQSAFHYQRALTALDDVHYLVPNAELNLASALHECGKTEVAIERLLALASPEAKWRGLELFPASQLDAQIRINAAAMMMALRDHSSAIEMLNGINSESLTPYWQNVKGYNLHLAYASSGFFSQADSIWSVHLQFLEPEQIPGGCFDQIIGSILAVDDRSYLHAIRDFVASKSSYTSFADVACFHHLLSPALDSASLQVNWSLLQSANLSKRAAVENMKQQRVDSSLFVALNEMEQTLNEKNERAVRLQGLTAASILLVFMILLGLFWKKRKKRLEIQRALESPGGHDSSIDPISSNIEPKLKILLEDIRTLSEALIRGKRIGEALMVVRKLEALHQFQNTVDESIDLSNLPGYEDLSSVEKEALRMTMMEIPTKEIAHQLRVSPGHVYNIRSAIRQKLEIPVDTRLESWLSGRMEEGMKP